jgi:pyruvate dehydrogenase E2 component (dihydrolipoamide acetyltransferase)
MARLFRMPEIAADTPQVLLAEWAVKENSTIHASEPIVTIETDKAAVDIEADGDGTVLRILVEAGSTVAVGTPIAVLADPGEQIANIDELLAELGVGEPVLAGVVVSKGTQGQRAPEPAATANGHTARILSSPLARRLARNASVDIESITGSGPGGRIIRRDVESAIAGTPATDLEVIRPGVLAAPAPQDDQAVTGPKSPDAGSLTPHTRMRRAIAKRLSTSKQTVPHFYLRGTCRVDELLALRTTLNLDNPFRISVNDLVIKAAARAHILVPALNVRWEEEGVRSLTTVDISAAIATDGGLVTPVLRSVESLSLSALSGQMQDFAARAATNKLQPAELDGGTLTITNLGMFGTEEFGAIINPPQSAILAIGAARPEPVVLDGQLAVATVMHVTLSVDHRPVDGITAARWMSAFTKIVESPLQILL